MLIAILLLFASSLLLYLCHPNQAILRRPLPPQLLVLAGLCFTLAAYLLSRQFSMVTSLLLLASTLMLLLGSVPFLALLRTESSANAEHGGDNEQKN
ncbi:hypothetical protein [Rheinheimera sp.]|uniref:hypothetical protein n=1 Tax=Rheinheimera sp. TaxID=1869214 RepID=UPI0037C6A23E